MRPVKIVCFKQLKIYIYLYVCMCMCMWCFSIYRCVVCSVDDFQLFNLFNLPFIHFHRFHHFHKHVDNINFIWWLFYLQFSLNSSIKQKKMCLHWILWNSREKQMVNFHFAHCVARIIPTYPHTICEALDFRIKKNEHFSTKANVC